MPEITGPAHMVVGGGLGSTPLNRAATSNAVVKLMCQIIANADDWDTVVAAYAAIKRVRNEETPLKE